MAIQSHLARQSNLHSSSDISHTRLCLSTSFHHASCQGHIITWTFEALQGLLSYLRRVMWVSESSIPLKHNRACFWTWVAGHTPLSPLSTIGTGTGRHSQVFLRVRLWHICLPHLLLAPSTHQFLCFQIIPQSSDSKPDCLETEIPQACRNKSKDPRILFKKKKESGWEGVLYHKSVRVTEVKATLIWYPKTRIMYHHGYPAIINREEKGWVSSGTGSPASI